MATVVANGGQCERVTACFNIPSHRQSGWWLRTAERDLHLGIDVFECDTMTVGTAGDIPICPLISIE